MKRQTHQVIRLYLIPQLPSILSSTLLVFHDSTLPLTTNSGHCLENDGGSQLEDADTATSSTMVRNSNISYSEITCSPVLIRSSRKVHTYHERMNRLRQLKNQYPIDVFHSFVTRLRSANKHGWLYHIKLNNLDSFI